MDTLWQTTFILLGIVAVVALVALFAVGMDSARRDRARARWHPYVVTEGDSLRFEVVLLTQKRLLLRSELICRCEGGYQEDVLDAWDDATRRAVSLNKARDRIRT